MIYVTRIRTGRNRANVNCAIYIPFVPVESSHMAGKERVTTSNISASSVRQPAAERKRVTSSDRLLRLAVTAGDVLPWEWDIARDRFRWGASPEWLLGPVGRGMTAHPDLRAIVHPDDRERFLAAGREAKERLGFNSFNF